jgi:transposase
MIPTPRYALTQYGIGGVNYHTGETVVLVREHKRRIEMVEFLTCLLEKHPTQTIYVVWDNVKTHQEGAVAALVKQAAGRLVLLYLPTYSPWLNPIEMLWRHLRREVTHCEFFVSMHDLALATMDFFARYNQSPASVLSIIGAIS